jgi:hypothetical protein
MPQRRASSGLLTGLLFGASAFALVLILAYTRLPAPLDTPQTLKDSGEDENHAGVVEPALRPSSQFCQQVRMMTTRMCLDPCNLHVRQGTGRTAVIYTPVCALHAAAAAAHGVRTRRRHKQGRSARDLGGLPACCRRGFAVCRGEPALQFRLTSRINPLHDVQCTHATCGSAARGVHVLSQEDPAPQIMQIMHIQVFACTRR